MVVAEGGGAEGALGLSISAGFAEQNVRTTVLFVFRAQQRRQCRMRDAYIRERERQRVRGSRYTHNATQCCKTRASRFSRPAASPIVGVYLFFLLSYLSSLLSPLDCFFAFLFASASLSLSLSLARLSLPPKTSPAVAWARAVGDPFFVPVPAAAAAAALELLIHRPTADAASSAGERPPLRPLPLPPPPPPLPTASDSPSKTLAFWSRLFLAPLPPPLLAAVPAAVLVGTPGSSVDRGVGGASGGGPARSPSAEKPALALVPSGRADGNAPALSEDGEGAWSGCWCFLWRRFAGGVVASGNGDDDQDGEQGGPGGGRGTTGRPPRSAAVIWFWHSTSFRLVLLPSRFAPRPRKNCSSS